MNPLQLDVDPSIFAAPPAGLLTYAALVLGVAYLLVVAAVSDRITR